MPLKLKHSHDELVSSGDFGFQDEISPTSDDDDDDDDNNDNYYEFSGSGDENMLVDENMDVMIKVNLFKASNENSKNVISKLQCLHKHILSFLTNCNYF